MEKAHIRDLTALVWDHGLYSVNYILNKGGLACSQAGSKGGTTRQEVEVGQGEQENTGKRMQSWHSHSSKM